MANRCYLACSDYNDIYPSFSDSNFDPESQWVVHGAGCLPLVWLPMFTDADLVSKQFEAEGQSFTETAPITSRMAGIERLLSQREFLNEVFRDSGGLNHHIDIFADYLRSVAGEYVTIELQEIGWLHPEGQFQTLLRDCLHKLAAKDSACRDPLLNLSTVIDGRRFITLEDAASGDYEDEDMWNYFRILGEPYIREVPWG